MSFISKEIVFNYIKSCCNNLLMILGLELLYDINFELLKEIEWFDIEIFLIKEMDFFNKCSIDYSKKMK